MCMICTRTSVPFLSVADVHWSHVATSDLELRENEQKMQIDRTAFDGMRNGAVCSIDSGRIGLRCSAAVAVGIETISLHVALMRYIGTVSILLLSTSNEQIMYV